MDKVQTLLDEHKKDMKEQTYIELSNLLMNLAEEKISVHKKKNYYVKLGEGYFVQVRVVSFTKLKHINGEGEIHECYNNFYVYLRENMFNNIFLDVVQNRRLVKYSDIVEMFNNHGLSLVETIHDEEDCEYKTTDIPITIDWYVVDLIPRSEWKPY